MLLYIPAFPVPEINELFQKIPFFFRARPFVKAVTDSATTSFPSAE
jgi:hypothetical protein